MELDLNRLTTRLHTALPEDTVPKGKTNSYLIAAIIEPVLNGRTVKYGDIDFSAFELDDLRRAAGYCDDIDRTASMLSGLVGRMSSTEAAACKVRSFC